MDISLLLLIKNFDTEVFFLWKILKSFYRIQSFLIYIP